MSSSIKPLDKLNVNPSNDCCDELLIDYIDSFGSNLANLRQDIRSIVREEVEQAIKHLRNSNAGPRKYVEVGYRGSGSGSY